MDFLYQTFKTTALCYPNKTAIITTTKQYSYEQLHQQAMHWANYLLELTAKQTQDPNISAKSTNVIRVALLTEQANNTAAIALAMAKINATCVPTNPQLTCEQLLDGWHASDVNIVLFEAIFAHKIKQCQQVKSSKALLFINIDSVFTPTKSSASVIKTPITVKSTQLSSKKKPVKTVAADDFIITLSSGSTGKPKPIMLSQQVKVKRAQQTWQLYQLTSNDVVLCASPFFHSLGQRLFFVPLLLGCTLVQIPQFTPKAWLSAVEEHRVSFVISVSSHLYALKQYLLTNATSLRSLKTMVTSSAPIDTQFKADLFKHVGCHFHEMYGATEIATTTNLAPEFSQQKYATVGTTCPQVEIEILDQDHHLVAVNNIGEIAVKTPLLFSGYYQQPELTQAAMHQQYFLTGDLGKLDNMGFLTYVGRKKDIIISGGINIYPKDIETQLAQHKEISELAVIGVTDNFLGEVILAICVIVPKSALSEQLIERELRRIANKNLAPFQRPLKYFFPKVLPLTASGKISKLELRQHYDQLNEDWSAQLRAIFYS